MCGYYEVTDCSTGSIELTLSVASVTTAYNSAGVLPRHIEALLRQTRQLQEIVVVDNASTDNTALLLAERYPQVTVLRMQENLGAAGAWAAGLTYAALEKKHDWVWNFDDDAVPDAATLESLLTGATRLAGDDEVGMLVPLPVHAQTGSCYSPLLWRNGFVEPSATSLKQAIWFADLVIASGCMVRREVVETIGLPRADFFMDFFDYDYCLRARSHGYKIAVVSDCKFSHETGNARQVRLPGFTRLWPNHPPWREYYISRNLAYAGWWLYPTLATKWFVARHLVRHAVGVVLFGNDKLAALRKMMQGVHDGRRAKLGVRFRPK